MVKNFILKKAQKKISSLKPKVDIHLNKELPTPSIKVITSLVGVVSKVNTYEDEIKKKPDSFFKEKIEKTLL